VLSGSGLCDELITRPEESYRLWCAVVCDLETSLMRRHWPTGGCRAKNKQTKCNNNLNVPLFYLLVCFMCPIYWHFYLCLCVVLFQLWAI